MSPDMLIQECITWYIELNYIRKPCTQENIDTQIGLDLFFFPLNEEYESWVGGEKRMILKGVWEESTEIKKYTLYETFRELIHYFLY